jgi:dienelactone hydrolase
VALQLRAREAGAPVELEVYEGAHHAFDRSSGHLRYRPDVRNPSSPTGWGAHVGPHPQARRKALERATAFLERHR